MSFMETRSSMSSDLSSRETARLSKDEIFELFSGTLSERRDTRVSAEERLSQIELRSGFLPSLLKFLKETGDPDSVRRLSRVQSHVRQSVCIRLKNLIKHYWTLQRNTDKSTLIGRQDEGPSLCPVIIEEDKQQVRELLFHLCLTNVDSSLRKILLFSVRHVIKADFPHSWPSIVDSLMQAAQKAPSILHTFGVVEMLLELFRLYRFKARDHRDNHLEKLVDKTFPTLLKLADSLLTLHRRSEGSDRYRMLHILKIVFRIFYFSITMGLPSQLIRSEDPSTFDSWLSLMPRFLEEVEVPSELHLSYDVLSVLETFTNVEKARLERERVRMEKDRLRKQGKTPSEVESILISRGLLNSEDKKTITSVKIIEVDSLNSNEYCKCRKWAVRLCTKMFSCYGRPEYIIKPSKPKIIMDDMNKEEDTNNNNNNDSDGDSGESIKKRKQKKLQRRLLQSYHQRCDELKSEKRAAMFFKEKYAGRLFKLLFMNVVKAATCDRQFVYFKTMSSAIKFIDFCIPYSSLFEPLLGQPISDDEFDCKPLSNLMFTGLYKLLCYTPDDILLWYDNPQEFAAQSFRMDEDLISSRFIAAKTLCNLVRIRTKYTLKRVLDFTKLKIDRANECVKEAQNKGLSPKSWPSNSYMLQMMIEKDGALVMIGKMRTHLIEFDGGRLIPAIKQLLIQHVFSDFDSPFGFLKCRVCWLITEFFNLGCKNTLKKRKSEICDDTSSEEESSDEEITGSSRITAHKNTAELDLGVWTESEYRRMTESVIELFLDSSSGGSDEQMIPVQITATTTIARLCSKRVGIDTMKPYIDRVLTKYIELMDEIGLESVMYMFSTLIDALSEDFVPFAEKIMIKLIRIFNSFQKKIAEYFAKDYRRKLVMSQGRVLDSADLMKSEERVAEEELENSTHMTNAAEILDCISTVLYGSHSLPKLMSRLESILSEEIIIKLWDSRSQKENGLFDAYDIHKDKIVELVEILVQNSRPFSPFLWSMYLRMIEGFCENIFGDSDGFSKTCNVLTGMMEQCSPLPNQDRLVTQVVGGLDQTPKFDTSKGDVPFELSIKLRMDKKCGLSFPIHQVSESQDLLDETVSMMEFAVNDDSLDLLYMTGVFEAMFSYFRHCENAGLKLDKYVPRVFELCVSKFGELNSSSGGSSSSSTTVSSLAYHHNGNALESESAVLGGMALCAFANPCLFCGMLSERGKLDEVITVLTDRFEHLMWPSQRQILYGLMELLTMDEAQFQRFAPTMTPKKIVSLCLTIVNLLLQFNYEEQCGWTDSDGGSDNEEGWEDDGDEEGEGEEAAGEGSEDDEGSEEGAQRNQSEEGSDESDDSEELRRKRELMSRATLDVDASEDFIDHDELEYARRIESMNSHGTMTIYEEIGGDEADTSGVFAAQLLASQWDLGNSSRPPLPVSAIDQWNEVVYFKDRIIDCYLIRNHRTLYDEFERRVDPEAMKLLMKHLRKGRESIDALYVRLKQLTLRAQESQKKALGSMMSVHSH